MGGRLASRASRFSIGCRIRDRELFNVMSLVEILGRRKHMIAGEGIALLLTSRLLAPFPARVLINTNKIV